MIKSKKNVDELLIWQLIFIASLLVANVLAGKIIMLFGTFVLPSAVVAYGFTFLATDIINEKWGRKEANKIVKYGFFIQVFASLLIYLAMLLPVAPFATETQDAFKILLGQNIRFVAASLVAYLLSQAHDVWSFNFWKNRTSGKYKWLRNNASTMVSQIIDTAIFITIAFAGTVPNLFIMILSQYFIKFIIALLDTPFFYLFTRKKKGVKNDKTKNT